MYKFQKISSNVDKYIINKKDNKLFSNQNKWVVTEKVHGSNFSIYYNNNKISFSKRNNKLNDDEWFYNYHKIKDKLIKNITDLASIMKEDNIVIYGELFGGWYPDATDWKGPEGVRINNKGISIVPFEDRAIQEGIYYSPNIEYMVFDVAIIKDKLEFIDYFKMVDYLKQTNFMYAKPLKIGSFSELQNFNINFDSHIPKFLGLSVLPLNTNTAEGIVIKPVITHYVKDKNNNDIRCLIKIKNKKFLEVADDFDMNEANNSYDFIFTKLINQNRYQAVISKIGALNEDNKEEIINEFADDAWNDFYSEYNVNINNYDKATDYVLELCKNLVNNNLYN
jgi:Rnl2 family RNA ligase